MENKLIPMTEKELRLPLKKQWFEMTKAGIKTEDYREMNKYWAKRFFHGLDKEEQKEVLIQLNNGRFFGNVKEDFLFSVKNFKINTMTLGYPKSGDKERTLKLEHLGIEIREGKAKEAFDIWYIQKARQRPDIGNRFWDDSLLSFLYNAGSTIKNAHIIEWLDSVGIHITVSYWIIAKKWQDVILGMYNGSFKYDTRQGATEAAIKKAVEIYNERNVDTSK